MQCILYSVVVVVVVVVAVVVVVVALQRKCNNIHVTNERFFCYVRALMEAQDIFGLDFDFDEFEKYGRDDFSSDEDEDEYEEEEKKKSTKKSIYEVRFEGFLGKNIILTSACPIEKCNIVVVVLRGRFKKK